MQVLPKTFTATALLIAAKTEGHREARPQALGKTTQPGYTTGSQASINKDEAALYELMPSECQGIQGSKRKAAVGIVAQSMLLFV